MKNDKRYVIFWDFPPLDFNPELYNPELRRLISEKISEDVIKELPTFKPKVQ